MVHSTQRGFFVSTPTQGYSPLSSRGSATKRAVLPPSRARGGEKMSAVGEGASEVRARDRRRVQEVVAGGLDPGLDPRHQVDEGSGELGRGEVAVADSA